MDLEALMQRPVITIAADMPLRQAGALMAQHGIRHLPVMEAGVLIGLLTDRGVRRAAPSRVPALVLYEQAALLDRLRVREP